MDLTQKERLADELLRAQSPHWFSVRRRMQCPNVVARRQGELGRSS